MNEVDGNRLEEFRQLKKEIRGSEKYLIVGVDVAKERHHAFFGTATGKTLLRRLIFENSLEGFRKLLDQLIEWRLLLNWPNTFRNWPVRLSYRPRVNILRGATRIRRLPDRSIWPSWLLRSPTRGRHAKYRV